MNIGLYGHSMAQWDRKQPFSYITKIKDYFEAEIVSTGVAQGSEERILFDLKKTKKIDLAIIFHSNPDFMFIPSLKRDLPTLDRDSLKYKIPNGSIRDWLELHGYVGVPESLLTFWNMIPNWACYELIQQFEFAPKLFADEIDNLPEEQRNLLNNWATSQDATIIKQLIREKNKFSDQVDFYLKLFDLMELHKEYLYHHDLQMNRYYGALIQIDQYLQFKKIPVVHCLGKSFWYPKWFKFSSGSVDDEIYKLQHEIHGHYAMASESDNNMNETGNQIAFDRLIPLIKQAQDKVK